jgi:hypothetical protein
MDKKPCKTCKKKQELKLSEPTLDIVNPLIWELEDVKLVYSYLTETKKLTDPQIGGFSSKLFKDVTGEELDIVGCMGCKSAKWKRMLKYHTKRLYNYDL